MSSTQPASAASAASALSAAATATASAAQVVDPTTSIFVYIGLTAVYFTMKYMMPERATALFVIYFILILVSQFILNIYLAKQMCNSPSNVGTAAIATIIPWVLIFGLLNLLLTMFPGWLAAFSNTIGYAVASIVGVSSLFTEKLLNVGTPPNKDAFKVIQNILSDPSTIINTLNDENVLNFWNKSVNVKLFKTDFQVINVNDDKNLNNELFYELKKYIMLKNLVSYFIWYLLTGILITSISYNYMLTVPCIQSPKQARAAAAQFLADKNNVQSSADAAKSNAPVYQTDGK
jgi:hypothetical protein